MFSGLLQVFLVKLGSQHGTSNYVLYSIPGVACSDSVKCNQLQLLKNPCINTRLQSGSNQQLPGDFHVEA